MLFHLLEKYCMSSSRKCLDIDGQVIIYLNLLYGARNTVFNWSLWLCRWVYRSKI